MLVRLLSSLVVIFALASPAAAQVSEVEMPPSEVAARGHYLMGQEHYEAARFAEAAEEFQRAYDLSHRPRLLFNLFIARRDAGQTRQAADALRLYIASAPDDPQLEVLRGRLSTLDAQLAAEDARARQAAPDDTDTGIESSVAPTELETIAPVTTTDEGGGNAGPWVVIGVGGAVAIAAVAMAIVTSIDYGNLSSTCTEGVCPPGTDLETGRTLALTSDILGGVGAATMIGGIVWAIVDATSSPSTRESASIQCTPLGCRGVF
jgi:hypothetical protein